MVKERRDQSQETPIFFICSTMRPPYFSFHAQARSKKPSRPTSFLVSPSFFISSTILTSVAMEAWSQPGRYSAEYPCIRLKRMSASMMVLSSACPKCSCPVMFGGGMTMVNGILDGSTSARK